jgi:Tfp pilus assembly protein PilX
MTDLRREDGWTLVTAILLMSMMLGLALASYAFVDTQQLRSAEGRKRETAFNVAEAVLNAQIYAMSREWPGKGKSASPYTACTEASTGARCPSAQTVGDLFKGSTDTEVGLAWRTEVHDNTDPDGSFYDDVTTRATDGYDANGDGKLWVRAQATARGKRRTLIALVRPQEQVEDLPKAALISGRLDISNHGRKTIIDASGGTSVSGLVAVRCTPALLEVEPCLGHELSGVDLLSALASLNSLLNFQISPNITVTGYGDAPALKAEAIARLRARAQSDGTYHATCPTELPSGYVVFIETGNCHYQSNNVVNSPSTPGFILLADATLRLTGTQRYYGIIYSANLSGSVGDVVDLGGNV